jgi:hypothetical protein
MVAVPLVGVVVCLGFLGVEDGWHAVGVQAVEIGEVGVWDRSAQVGDDLVHVAVRADVWSTDPAY